MTNITRQHSLGSRAPPSKIFGVPISVTGPRFVAIFEPTGRVHVRYTNGSSSCCLRSHLTMPPDPEPAEPPGGWTNWDIAGKRALARFFIDGDKSDRYGNCQGSAYRSWGDLQKKNLAFRNYKPKPVDVDCCDSLEESTDINDKADK